MALPRKRQKFVQFKINSAAEAWQIAECRQRFHHLDARGLSVSIVRRADCFCYDFSRACLAGPTKAEFLGYRWLEYMNPSDVPYLANWLKTADEDEFYYRTQVSSGQRLLLVTKWIFGPMALIGGDGRSLLDSDLWLFTARDADYDRRASGGGQ